MKPPFLALGLVLIVGCAETPMQATAVTVEPPPAHEEPMQPVANHTSEAILKYGQALTAQLKQACGDWINQAKAALEQVNDGPCGRTIKVVDERTSQMATKCVELINTVSDNWTKAQAACDTAKANADAFVAEGQAYIATHPIVPVPQPIHCESTTIGSHVYTECR